MNEIPEIQNAKQQLDKLAAQRQIYSDAKKVAALQMFLVIVIIAIWSILVVFNPDLKIYAVFCGIIIVFLDILILTPRMDSLKEKGAKMKELFDCKVLELPWYDLKVGPRPDPETIIKYSLKHYRKNFKGSKLENWYPITVQKLRMPLARLVCQRSNLWWDAELRAHYVLVVAVAIVCLTILILLFGLIEDMILNKFLLEILVPIMPLVFWGIHQYKAHKASISRQQRLKEYVDKLWGDTLGGKISDTQLEIASQNLQNEIYEYRRSNPLIFDWIYKLQRNKQEEQMNKSIELLLKEVRESDRKSECS